MTLNGYFALNSVFAPVWLAPIVRLSRNNCVKTNKDRHILSPAQTFGRDSSFWQYEVCADAWDLYKKDEIKGQWGRALALVLDIFSWLSKTIA